MENARRRISNLQIQIRSNNKRNDVSVKDCSQQKDLLHSELPKTNNVDVDIKTPPRGSEVYYNTLLTSSAVSFVAELTRTFNSRVDEIMRERIMRKAHLDATNELPDFNPTTSHIRRGAWQVKPVPRRLICRHVDLGDVSPSNTSHFTEALKSTAQGIQTDFDDGHCPSWFNQLLGLYNVYRAVHNEIPGAPSIEKAPVLMLRPRAWNMVEHNMMVDGREVPGPLFDFGLLMFHNAQILLKNESGPFFYLSKLEGANEARLWDEIFRWSQVKLGLPIGTIKACVLIENVLASFEMHEILYKLREHSLGLNCGMWDYSASFVNKFGQRSDFVLPDRSKYVSMDRHFLKSYMDLVIQTCHQRGCHATGGMSAILLPSTVNERQRCITIACGAKLKEIHSGADGFMVYDLGLVKPMQDTFNKFAPSLNQYHVKRSDVTILPKDLLLMPSGGVTVNGLKHNIGVGILFIYNWLNGCGHFYYKGAVEDSATAEISRSQVWQWIYHRAKLEDSHNTVTRRMVEDLVHSFIEQCFSEVTYGTELQRVKMTAAAKIFQEIVTKRDFPEFITTYLNLEHAFLKDNM